MPKGYWVVTYQEIRDAEALAAYAKLAGPAVTQAGGRFLARGTPALVWEQGRPERVVVVEFEDLDAAQRFYQSPAYQRALAHLRGGAVLRDVRILEGV